MFKVAYVFIAQFTHSEIRATEAFFEECSKTSTDYIIFGVRSL